MILARILSIGFCVATVVGCIGRGYNSDVQHKVGAFARPEAGPWMWFETNYAEWAKPRGMSPAADGNLLLSKRLQLWLDTLFDAAKKAYPNELNAVPRPVVALSSWRYNNAFAGGVMVRYPIPVELPDHVGGKKILAMAVDHIPSPERLGLKTRYVGAVEVCDAKNPCADAKVTPPIPAFIDWLGTAPMNCKIPSKLPDPANPGQEIAADRIVLTEADCGNVSGGMAKEVASAESFIAPASASVIIMGSSFVEIAPTEEALVSILAHELSHYLRGHMGMLNRENKYGYPFDDSKDRKRVGAPEGGMGRGVYTFEQEADEYSLELLNLIGLDVKAATDMFMAKLEDKEKNGQLNGGEATPAECRTMMEAGFKKGSKLTPPAIGDTRDPHHAVCYRIFNFTMENVAHKYKTGARTVPAWSESEWKAAREEYLATLPAVVPPRPTLMGSMTKSTSHPDYCPEGSLCD